MSATYESLIAEVSPRQGLRSRVSNKAPACTPHRDDEPTVRSRAISVVKPRAEKNNDGRIGRSLVSLRLGNRSERIGAARLLGDIAFTEGQKVPEAVVPLCVALKSDMDPAVRQEAAWSLWKLSDERAYRPLIASLVGDRSSRVREKAARALGLLGVEDAAPIMMDLLSLGKHIPGKLRASLAASLGFLAEEDALPLLMDAAEDADPAVRVEAVQSLGRYLIDFSEDTVDRAFARVARYAQAKKESCAFIRQAAIRALRMSPEERANLAVVKAAKTDPDPQTRELAAEALSLWNSQHSEAALIEMLCDDVWRVRKAAARFFARFVSRNGAHKSGAACEALAKMLRMFPSSSEERKLAEAAAASIDRLKSKNLRPALLMNETA